MHCCFSLLNVSTSCFSVPFMIITKESLCFNEEEECYIFLIEQKHSWFFSLLKTWRVLRLSFTPLSHKRDQSVDQLTDCSLLSSILLVWNYPVVVMPIRTRKKEDKEVGDEMKAFVSTIFFTSLSAHDYKMCPAGEWAGQGDGTDDHILRLKVIPWFSGL